MKISKQFLFIACLVLGLNNQTTAQKNTAPYSAYLFAYFTGNEKNEEAIRFAISKDGYHYAALNDDKAVISSDTISETGGVRDPHILRGADGKTFYMVVTDMVSANGWNSNRAMVLLKSTDLLNWSHAVVNIQKLYPNADNLERVWAPQTIYDSKSKKYMVYWAMKYKDTPDRIYYAYANKNFTGLEGTPKQLFFSKEDKSCIDADIIEKDGKYHLFYKTEGNGNGIRQAISDNLTNGYIQQDEYLQQTDDPVEGSGVFKLNDRKGYILMYDRYTKGKYQFTYSEDLNHFKVIDQDIAMNFHPRHGTVMPITTKEAERLAAKWYTPATSLLQPNSPFIKIKNIGYDTATSAISFILKPGASLQQFNPEFTSLPGVSITPSGMVDFSTGPVNYTVTFMGMKPQGFTIKTAQYNNPVLDGFYADPEILYAEKTGKFYIYPTSDGFTDWSGTYFKAFSSPDLVNWSDEGKILELGTDVKWANRNAWAPCIIEQKINGGYKYFYYFCAAQKIGVAVADNPTGPFTDMGQPLIDKFPPGVKGGQQIDPDVFKDPVSGKNYLYWGNGYMAVAELNEDMVSIKDSTLKVITPDNSFREGVYVFFRKGTYYFMWSENDTRDENYGVRYGTSTSPLGPITIPQNNQVITKNKAAGLYGTGHNSVLQIPGKDEWYLVYHRFNYPNGIHWGKAAGYNREVCIDKMEFNEDGSIKQVIPTQEGISAVKVQ
ncbi:MAG: family 43 glycosylhydrolase [Ferruginibacter sp.]